MEEKTRYCITLERTQRIAVWFEADGDDDACIKAEGILEQHKADPSKFESGDVEYDYALDDDGGRSVIAWN